MTRLSAPPFFFYNNLKITNDKCLWTILHICVFDVQFLFIRRIKEVYEHNCIMTNSWQHPHCTPCFHKPFNSDVLVYYKNEETAIQYVYRYDFFCCCCFLEVFFVFWKTHILQGTHFHLLLKKKKKRISTIPHVLLLTLTSLATNQDFLEVYRGRYIELHSPAPAIAHRDDYKSEISLIQ